MSGHTPGPWAMVPWHIEEGPTAVRSPGGWLICTTSSDDNARLIASAPELLDVAKRSAFALISAGIDADAHSDNPLEGLLHMTEAAIAKATGHTP